MRSRSTVKSRSRPKRALGSRIGRRPWNGLAAAWLAASRAITRPPAALHRGREILQVFMDDADLILREEGLVDQREVAHHRVVAIVLLLVSFSRPLGPYCPQHRSEEHT